MRNSFLIGTLHFFVGDIISHHTLCVPASLFTSQQRFLNFLETRFDTRTPTDQKQAGGTLPIQSDCVGLSSQILASSTTYSLAPAACVTSTYGTCVGAMCRCNVRSMYWAGRVWFCWLQQWYQCAYWGLSIGSGKWGRDRFRFWEWGWNPVDLGV